MRSTCFLAAVLAATATAFIVPQDLPDGVYSFTFDEFDGTGTEPVLLHSFDHVQRSNDVAVPRHALHPRQETPPPPNNPWPTCYDGALNLPDFAVAKAEFELFCEDGTEYVPNTAIVVAYGDAIAYMCNFNAFHNRCWPSDYDEASTVLDAECGEESAGRAYVEFWHKSYGRGSTGDDICVIQKP